MKFFELGVMKKHFFYDALMFWCDEIDSRNYLFSVGSYMFTLAVLIQEIMFFTMVPWCDKIDSGN